MRSLVQIYALLVCFCSLMCFVIALGVGAYDVIEIAAPDLTLTADRHAYYPYASILTDGKTHTEAELAEARAVQELWSLDYHRRSAIASLIFTAIVCAIDVVVFAVHWWIARREAKLIPIRV